MRWTALLLAWGCAEPVASDWTWDLPSHVDEPEVPALNPMSVEKVELGRYLFYDFQLSVDGGRSCGICHEPAKGFTDGFVRAIGTTGQIHPRNTLTVGNVAWREVLNWRDPEPTTLEEQLLVPLLGEHPIVEMGMGGREEELLDRLRVFEPYPSLFAAAFGSRPMTVEAVAQAIAAFQRSIVLLDSPYDRYLDGETTALSASAARGMDLFFGPRLACGQCHSGVFLDRSLESDGSVGEVGFYNTGQYDIDGMGSYPPEEPGLVAVTGDPAQTGAFRTPSLRNVTATWPWGHDGTTLSLEDRVDAYARGGRLLEDVTFAGDGALNRYKSPLIAGFEWTDDERADLLAFLASLTDHEGLRRPEYADPFCRDEPTPGCVVPRSFD